MLLLVPGLEAHIFLVEVRVVPHAEEVLVHVALDVEPRESGAAQGLEVLEDRVAVTIYVEVAEIAA